MQGVKIALYLSLFGVFFLGLVKEEYAGAGLSALFFMIILYFFFANYDFLSKKAEEYKEELGGAKPTISHAAKITFRKHYCWMTPGLMLIGFYLLAKMGVGQ